VKKLIVVLAVAVAFLSGIRSARADDEDPIIDVGQTFDVGRQVSGPVIGTVVGVDVKGSFNDGQTQYFWVTGRMLVADKSEGGALAPIVDLRIVPLAGVSMEERARFRDIVTTGLVPIHYQRDLTLDTNKILSVYALSLGYAFESRLTSNEAASAISIFGNLAVDLVGLIHSRAIYTPTDGSAPINLTMSGINAGELSGSFGGSVKWNSVSIQLTAIGLDGMAVPLKSGAAGQDGTKYDGVGVDLYEIYEELALGVSTHFGDLALFARNSNASSRYFYAITDSNGQQSADFSSKWARRLQIGMRIIFR
jgi:hypothetical protein